MKTPSRSRAHSNQEKIDRLHRRPSAFGPGRALVLGFVISLVALPTWTMAAANGRSAMIDPNGRSAMIDPNGRSAMIDPNGRSAMIDPNGRSAMIDPNG